MKGRSARDRKTKGCSEIMHAFKLILVASNEPIDEAQVLAFQEPFLPCPVIIVIAIFRSARRK